MIRRHKLVHPLAQFAVIQPPSHGQRHDHGQSEQVADGKAESHDDDGPKSNGSWLRRW
jgi:hypothetical protein